MESGLIFRRQLATKIQRCFHIFFGRCINVVELTLFQRGIRVDFLSASFNDVVCDERLAIDVRTICIFNIFTTSFRRCSTSALTSFQRCIDVFLPTGFMHLVRLFEPKNESLNCQHRHKELKTQ